MFCFLFYYRWHIVALSGRLQLLSRSAGKWFFFLWIKLPPRHRYLKSTNFKLNKINRHTYQSISIFENSAVELQTIKTNLTSSLSPWTRLAYLQSTVAGIYRIVWCNLWNLYLMKIFPADFAYDATRVWLVLTFFCAERENLVCA